MPQETKTKRKDYDTALSREDEKFNSVTPEQRKREAAQPIYLSRC